MHGPHGSTFTIALSLQLGSCPRFSTGRQPARGALIPLDFDSTQPATRLLVHSSPLLDALVMCFEALWQRATKLDINGVVTTAQDESIQLDERDRAILRMLAAGHKDLAIARALGITQRTVVRRTSELMRHLDADTRFQAGVQAAHHGWL